MAPNAATGAIRITLRMIQNRARCTVATRSSAGCARSPSEASPQANRTEKTRIWRISPSAKAPIAEVGTRLTRNASKPSDAAGFVLDGSVGNEAGSMFTPAPGWRRLTTTSPITSATVVTTSK